MKRRGFLKSLVTAGTLMGTALTGMPGEAAAETTLRVGSWLPPSHPIVKDMMAPWAAQVEVATEGRVKVQILKAKLGKPSAYFDIARDGIADVTYGAHGYTPGRFLLTQATEMPFLSNSAEALSVAYWKVFNEQMATANEHRGTKVLSVFTHGPGHIYNSVRKVKSTADLDGMKIRIGGGVVYQVATALGVVPVAAPAPKVYELLSNGVTDGVMFPKESVPFFKIAGIMNHATFVDRGLYNSSFFLVMNQNTWRSLSKEDQAAIDSVSGEVFARMAGQAWDKADANAVQAMKDAGMSLIDADSAMMAELKGELAGIEADWIRRAEAAGHDGKAIMKSLRSIVAANGG